MADQHFDLIVIGGGPGGYVAAIRAAQLGFKTAIVERAKLGGVCLNWGCIPTKALLANAEIVEKVRHADQWGLSFDGFKFDWAKTIARSRDAAKKLNQGVAFLMKKNKITHFDASAKVTKAPKGGPVTVELRKAEVQEELTHAPVKIGEPQQSLTADHVIIATGSVARDLPFARFDGKKIWGAREAMFNQEQPKKLVIIGAGAIGIEFAYFYHTFGTQVTVIEMQDRILPVEDADISKSLEKVYKKKGMDIRTSTTTLAVDTAGPRVKVTIAPLLDGKPDDTKKETIDADRVLLAVGVKGRYDGLFDDSLGLETFKDHIKTDYVANQTGSKPIDYKTNLPNVYAIGDVIGPPWLAHVSSEEGVICVERIAHRAGKLHHEPIPMDYSAIPGCTYCHPQVASVGFTEQQLQAQGLKKGTDYDTGSVPFSANGKAIAANATDGLVKLIRGLPRGEILGAHIMCDVATEMIGEYTTARRLEATTEEIIATVHAHPTMSEWLHEAALASEGRTINM